MRIVKPSVSNLEDYVVTQAGAAVKMNQNESPFDLAPELKQEISARLLQTGWNRYPDGSALPLIQSLSRYTGHPEQGILAGNGSNELIQALINAVCRPGDTVLVVKPGFSVYSRTAAVMDLNVIEVPMKPDFSYDTEALLQAAGSCRLIFLASPHNPAGCVFPRSKWKTLLEGFNGILAADEAYFEFHRETVQDLLEKSPRLIVLRTLSKALGLAGLRLGYAMGSQELITGVRKARLPFSVGIFQQTAGTAVLENREGLDEKIKLIIGERERMLQALKNVPGVRPFPSRANFILMELTETSGQSVFEHLYSRGILVRSFGQPELKNTIRVTIGPPRDNDRFLAVLQDILGEKNEDRSSF
jgi:histidinol-phosphate aminotransferase